MDDLPVKVALPIFRKEFNLDIPGGDDEIVRIVIGRIVLYIPNFETRKKIVLLHDIHHLATGYSAFFKGETEISAWELSAGCYNNWVAFIINIYAFMIGLIINPTKVWRAWVRGRNTRTLYFMGYPYDELLQKTVGAIKKELGLMGGTNHRMLLKTIVSFILMIIIGLAVSILSILLVPLTIFFTLYIRLKSG